MSDPNEMIVLSCGWTGPIVLIESHRRSQMHISPDKMACASVVCSPICGATSVFWPDDERCDVLCTLPRGHEPANIHDDEILGEWDEND